MGNQIPFDHESEMPYVPVSQGDMAWNKTGTWRTQSLSLRLPIANNSPPATKPATDMTNPPSATHSPGADTNFPPGKLDLIPGRRAVPRRYDR